MDPSAPNPAQVNPIPNSPQTTPQPSIPGGSRRFSKKVVIIPAIILIVFIALGALYFLRGTSQTPQSPTPNATPAPLTGLEAARKMNVFLNKAIKPDGSLIMGYFCKDDKCEVDPTPPVTNGYSILYYLSLFEKTNDQTYKSQADKATDFWVKKCEAGERVACTTNASVWAKYYKDTKNQKYLDLLVKNTNATSAGSLTDEFTAHNVKKLTTLYEATQDQKYLNQAKTIASRYMTTSIEQDSINPQLYTDGDKITREYSFELVNFIFLPLYKTTKDPVYLTAAQRIIDNANVTGHVGQLLFHGSPRQPTILILWESLLDLAENSTGDKKTTYTSLANTIGREVVFTFWDTPDNKKFNGDYGFVEPYEKKNSVKSTITNSQIGLLLLRMSDSQFHIVR